MYHKYVYINLQLTDKAAKVCGAPTKTLEMPWDKYLEPTDDDLNEFIKSEFMPELVERIISVKPDFRFLKLNDYVCVVTPGKTESQTIGQVVHIQDDLGSLDKDVWRAGGSSEQVIEKWNLLYKMIMD